MSQLFQSLPEVVAFLAEKKVLRPLDLQFAKFVSSLESEHRAEVMWLAALTSANLGQGHICVNLAPITSDINTPEMNASPESSTLSLASGSLPLASGSLPSASLLGIYGEVAQQIDGLINQVDWLRVLNDAKSITTSLGMLQSGTPPTPLVWQHDRLYLHRYYRYEQTIADRMNAMASAIIIESPALLANLLDQLFAREYHYLFSSLQQLPSEKNTQVVRQQLVCDFLDVVTPESINWGDVDQKLMHAKQCSDLSKLDNLIPLSCCLNWQKVAAAVALTRRFSVISGGPGTGKTTTVTKLLAALVHQAGLSQQSPIIKLVAPTGKAAARLTESIGKALSGLAIEPEILAKIPTESSTIHRLLGAIPNRVEFRHHRENPLHLDVLVLDEASMVDLPMMHRLLDALPAYARLILLGDKDQLASVEAGAVLSDICEFASQGYSQGQNETIKQLTQFDCRYRSEARHSPSQGNLQRSAVADGLCVLQKSYRFDARSGIGQLAKTINASDTRGFGQVWDKGFTDIAWHHLTADAYQNLLQSMVKAYQPYLQVVATRPDGAERQTADTLAIWQRTTAKSALASFSSHRLLCAVREGDFGVVGLNQRIEQRLKQRGIIGNSDAQWYAGRPVMVTRNDHNLGLYNGDIGLCMMDYTGEVEKLKVFFELPDGSIKSVLPSRVPDHETAYAMTIHKSQGSEFTHTFMILPAEFSPLLTKELIYTGITRAKKTLTLIAEPQVVLKAIRCQTIRHSGLSERLST
ncbi:exodeoxyribonuclease V subunit alpha [Vibrio nomapromontoriensis]|uniref:exodeoxyribonuclease V subunit alpha n=1 Tax=Vibrio nomapromontoriensis TaxID=2910246 RepID=UPI003D0DB7FE